MKILAIHFKNINSLEGENSIDFTQPPISDTGVFAITGANGSGKSSILDAITLGLYGETFRLHSPAAFVMTKRTADCFAEVQFLLDGRRYQSSWRVQRTDADPEGEIQPPQMQLQRLDDGEVLASGQAQVCAQIAELTGMDFRNFTRSILLAQGDFAAFLNALDSERMDILEKIVGTDIYAAYQREITERNDNAQRELVGLNEQLSQCQVLEPEQLEAYQQDLADFTEQYQELAAGQTLLQQQQAAAMAINGLRERMVVAETQARDANAELNGIDAKLEKIAATQGVLLFKDELQGMGEQKQAVSGGQASLTALTAELDGLKKQLAGRSVPENLVGQSLSEQQTSIAELSGKLNLCRSNQQSEIMLSQALIRQATEKKAAIEKISVWLENHAADESLLENFPETGKLKKLRLEIIELAGKYKQFAKQDQKISAAFKSYQSAIEQSTKKQRDLERQLVDEQADLEVLSQNKTPEQLGELRSEQLERVKEFQRLYDLALAYKQLTKKGGSWFGWVDDQEPVEDTERLGLELETISEQLRREENIQRTLEQSRVFEALVRKMERDRKHLVDGKPCPLCGALEHPYSKRPPVFADPLKAAADQQLKIRNLQAVAERLRKQIDTNQKNAAKNQATTQRRQQLQSQWLSLCHRLNAAAGLEIKDLPAMGVLLSTEQRQLKEISALFDNCRDKRTRIGNLQKQLAENAQLLAGLKLKAEQLPPVSQEHQQLTATLAALQQEEQVMTAKIAAQLSALGEKMPDRGKEDALFDKLNERRQDYHGYAFRKKSLVNELEGLQRKQTECEQEISRYQELLDLYSEQLQAAEIVGLHLAITEKQKLLIEKEQLLFQQQSQLQASRQVVQEKLAASPFQSLDEVQSLLNLHATQAKLESEKNLALQLLAERQAELTKLTGLLAEQEQQHPEFLPVDELDRQLKSIREKMDIAKLESQRLQKILDGQTALQRRYDEIERKLQQHRLTADACAAEVALLNADHGMALRRKAQSRLAEKLLSQANLLLEKLSGRYYLRQKPDSQGLGLEIEDTFQGNARRLPKTLSGGETFVVSLALALGLSELANNGKAVDSLFLDEGFGNLDAESLYTVVSTLETLKTHGKTVGVISHVEAVQKRFKAQLQVVKKPNGMGELRRVS